MITPLHSKDFPQADVDEFHRLMTDLLAVCRELAADNAPEDVWKPRSSDLFGQLSESMALIANLSRALNSTRGGIRRITGAARMRLHDRATEPTAHQKPGRSLGE